MSVPRHALSLDQIRALPPDKHLRRSPEDYAYGFQALLPRGQAWPREKQSTLRKVCDALAWFWAYVDGRIADLIEREADPQKTVELLPEWETAFGLPEECFPEAGTIAERQKMLVTKMTWQGGQSRQYFIDIMEWLGFRIEIQEWSPFMAGVSRCGDTRLYPPRPDQGLPGDEKLFTEVFRWNIGPPEGRFVWSARVGYKGLSWFRAGSGQAGVDHHLEFINPLAVECLLMRWKPAHTWLRFNYSPLDWTDPMEGTP
jgi:uncharacterized protein YmfQ (DUF2313 family)